MSGPARLVHAAPAGGDRPSTTPLLVAGDPLRALAALGVLLMHVTAYAGFVLAEADPNPAGTAIERFGILGRVFVGAGGGLSLFFVLSGFLLARPFVAAWWHGAPRPSVRRYARHRLVRIVPAYYVLVFACLLVFAPAAGTDLLDRLAVPAFVQGLRDSAFVVPIGHGWSLGAEMLFYVLLGVAALGLVARDGRPAPARGPRTLAAALAVLAAATLGFALLRTQRLEADPRSLLHPWNSLGSFTPGIALAFAEQAARGRRRPAGARWVAVALVLAGVGLLLATPSLTGLGPTSLFAVPTGGATLVLAGLLLAEWSGPAWPILDNRVLHWLGARSYGIYLVHYPICIAFILHMDQTRWWRSLAIMLPVTLAGSIAGAALLHRLVERPALAFRDGRPRRAPAPAVAVVPAGLAPAAAVAGAEGTGAAR